MKFQFEPIGDENVFEEFSQDLLNFYYSTNSFEKYKSKGASQHGVDIFSSQLKIVIQCKKKKLQRADKTIINELFEDFNQSINLLTGFQHDFNKLIVITTSKKYGEIQDHALKLSRLNGFEILFWSWEDIEPFIIQFEQLRKKYYPHLWNSPELYFPKVLTYLPKIEPNNIIGRDNEIQILKAALKENSNAVVINGIGGIGKSSLAKLYTSLNNDIYDHILWIDAHATNEISIEKSISINDSFINNIVLLENIKVDLREDLLPSDKMIVVFNKIQNIPGNNLLVIDGATNEIMKYSEKIPGKPNWSVLLTSRDKFSDNYTLNVEVLTNSLAKQLFYKHYKIDKNEDINLLLKQIGNHTLTIELFAKTANKRKILIVDLIKAIDIEGLNISKVANVYIEHDSYKELVNPFDYLNRIFSIARLKDEELEILRYFAVMPSTPINYNELKVLFQISDDDNNFFEIISELESTGWINSEGDDYWMHQIIQTVLRNKLKPSFKSCEILITSLTKLLSIQFNENPLDTINYVLIAENVAQYIKDTDSPIMVSFLITLGLREGDLSNFSKDLHFQNRALLLLEKNPSENLEQLAICYNNLQYIHKTLGDIHEALLFQLAAIKIQEGMLEPLHPDLGTSYNNLSLIYQILGKIDDAYNFQEKAIFIAENTLEENHPHLANVYNNYSLLLYESDYLQDAINYQEKSFEIRKKILDELHPNIAEGYGNLGMMYYAKGDLKKGKDFLEKSIELKKIIYSETHYSLGTTYNNLASIYINENKLLKAEEAQKMAVQIEENSLGMNHFTLATTHSTMALIQLKLGNIKKARESVLQSISITQLNFPDGHESMEMYNAFLNHISKL